MRLRRVSNFGIDDQYLIKCAVCKESLTVRFLRVGSYLMTRRKIQDGICQMLFLLTHVTCFSREIKVDLDLERVLTSTHCGQMYFHVHLYVNKNIFSVLDRDFLIDEDR